MSMAATEKAVILARGLGTRMRKASPMANLTKEQATEADSGVKALVSVAPAGRPFLDYVLAALADAGYRRVCLVVGPEHGSLRARYGRDVRCERLRVEFAIQADPLGTADAVAAAADFCAGDPFLTINSDNYYPVQPLQALREMDGSGLAVFGKQAMLAGSNIPAERLSHFAVVESDSEGYLTKIIEKPTEETLRALPEPVYVSMNCWRFESSIFAACRAISPSPRGEFEVTDAVQYLINSEGQRFRALTFDAPVLDLTTRGDVASVAARLAGMEVRL